VGDWNGDGIDTPGVVRGATWYLSNSNSGGHAHIAFAYGNAGDRPLVGDWNGDGIDTPGVVRGATWYLSNSNTGGHAHIAFAYGNAGDRLLGERPDLRLPTLRPGDRGPAVAQLQHRLEALGFWVGAKDGVYGSLTEQAVFAVQKYHRMPVTGVADHPTRLRIDRGPRVQAASGHGDVIEVDKYRQLIFVVRGGHTLWAFNTSTGNEQPYTSGGRWYSAVTPTGRFQIFRQIDGWRQSHLGRLYRPKYFTTSGIAIHGSTSVPPFPASHGCVRLTLAAMDYVWGANLAPIGTQVLVYGSLP
ncbi:MAG: L,D-transpeptidase family protein, partial [Actinobacteria bacterium]|nr:L,D-transpeptidase family protein [Actinomycetota bacterium]